MKKNLLKREKMEQEMAKKMESEAMMTNHS
jgi:hypothetical protein